MYDKSKFDTKLIGLYKGDWDRLARMYRDSRPTVVIRDLVRKHIREIDEVTQAASELTHNGV